MNTPPPQLETAATSSRLKRRERQVLQHLVEGRSYKEIAVSMGVTVRTVSSYVASIKAELDTSSRDEAVARAVALGLVHVRVQPVFTRPVCRYAGVCPDGPICQKFAMCSQLPHLLPGGSS